MLFSHLEINSISLTSGYAVQTADTAQLGITRKS